MLLTSAYLNKSISKLQKLYILDELLLNDNLLWPEQVNSWILETIPFDVTMALIILKSEAENIPIVTVLIR